MDAIFAQYAAVKESIAKLDQERLQIAQKIVDHMKEKNIMEEANDHGKFIIGMKKSWEYSDGIYKLDADLKDLRDKEQADGTANFIETPFLRFTSRVPKE